MASHDLAELQPYLNPEYWGNYSTEPQAPEEQIRVSLFDKSRRTAKSMMQERIARMAKAIPLETYGDGEVFAANDYEPGTLFIFREESLVMPAQSDVLTADAPQQPLPPRPFDTSPNFDLKPSIEVISVGDIKYATKSLWGIVADTKKYGTIAYTISTGLVYKIGPDAKIMSLLQARHPQIATDETKHRVNNARERLERVNVLDVVSYGEAQKKKKKLFSFASKLATRTNGA